jgi:ferredoxin
VCVCVLREREREKERERERESESEREREREREKERESTYGRMLASVCIACKSCFQYKHMLYIHNIRGIFLS